MVAMQSQASSGFSHARVMLSKKVGGLVDKILWVMTCPPIS